MSAQFSFYLTDEQVRAIKGITTTDDITFTADGTVKFIDWREYDVKVWTFHRDGSYVLEERGLDSDGWETYTFDKEDN
jgi:hypothetical protein